MEKKLSRREVFKSIFNDILSRILRKRSRAHLENNYPQLLSFQFDVISNGITIEGIYEKNYLENVIKFLTKKKIVNGVAIDIGANIGNHSIYFSQFYNDVYAFEPNPKIYKALLINTEDHKNVYPFNLGLGNKQGQGYITISNRQNLGSAQINMSKSEKETSSQPINITQLDNFWGKIDKEIGLIKIDVEGMELKVLKGGINIIRNYKPVIIFEQHKDDFKNNRSEVINFIRGMDYQIYVPRYKPKRSDSLSTFRRYFNNFIALLTGASFLIEKNNSPTPDFYPMVIALPKN